MKIARCQMRTVRRPVQSCPTKRRTNFSSLLSCMRSSSSIEGNPPSLGIRGQYPSAQKAYISSEFQAVPVFQVGHNAEMAPTVLLVQHVARDT